MSETLHPSGLELSLITDLHRRAQVAAEHAYAPYSGFRVGAALLLAGPGPDAIVAGCNVENSSYRLTTCAEQTAIVSAVAAFGPLLKLRAVVIANLNHASSSPCGACRQTILEFSTPDTWVFYPGKDGKQTSSRIADLLPAGFTFQFQS